MTILFIYCAALTLAYTLLMLLYLYGWLRQPVFCLAPAFEPSTRITVVIPARNEAANIMACLRSILGQEYPAGLVEIIVADDHSDDETATLAAAADARVRVIFVAEQGDGNPSHFAPKKRALATGISHGSGELIVTTDADCVAPAQWLRQIAALYERSHAAMIVAPVTFLAGGGLTGLFQSLDFMTMQGITAAAHELRLGDMANGANLAFRRDAFEAVNGYSGIDHLASGDDYLLLHKMRARFPSAIRYLKSQEAIVATAPQPDWSSFLQQRIRWASKSGKYPDHRLTAILGLVFIFNVTLLIVAVAACFAPALWLWLACMLAAKLVAELLFLVPVARFFRRPGLLPAFPFLQPLHILYIVLAGFLGMIGSYRWKGRTLR